STSTSSRTTRSAKWSGSSRSGPAGPTSARPATRRGGGWATPGATGSAAWEGPTHPRSDPRQLSGRSAGRLLGGGLLLGGLAVGLELVEQGHALLTHRGVEALGDEFGCPAPVGVHGPHLTGLVPYGDLRPDRRVDLPGHVLGPIGQQVDHHRRHVLGIAHLRHIHRN